MAALEPGNHCIGRHESKAGRSAGGLAATLLALLAAGCATAPLDEAGSLASYNDLKPSDGLLTRSLVAVSKDRVLAAKTIKIAPTAFSAPAVREPLTPAQRHIVVNAVDRALCEGLSERFEVVGPSDSADLTVHAVVTHIAATNAIAAGVSKGASVAVGVALPGVPVPVPRIPVGLGSLSLEAEARDQDGAQQAAMIWGRGANAFVDPGRVAPEGDAYNLASAFGADFSKLLVTGTTPFGKLPSLPSIDNLRTAIGGKPKYAACETFGPSPGVVGFVGGAIGVPPDWTDKGAAPPKE